MAAGQADPEARSLAGLGRQVQYPNRNLSVGSGIGFNGGMGAELDHLGRCLSRAEGKIEALELDTERCHHQLDEYGVPRQSATEPRSELSLSGRLEMFLEDLEQSRAQEAERAED